MLVLVLGLPIVASLLLSLRRLHLADGPLAGTWVGFGNYSQVVHDPAFGTALRNSIYFTAV